MSDAISSKDVSPLQSAIGTIELAKMDAIDPDGCTCELSPQEATALWDHIQQLRAELASATEHNTALVDIAKNATRDAADHIRKQFGLSVETFGDWRPMSSAPHDGTYIWLACDTCMRVGYWLNERWADANGQSPRLDLLYTPTCWQPLPRLPVKSEGSQS